MRRHTTAVSTLWGLLAVGPFLLLPALAPAQGLVPGHEKAALVMPSAPRTFGITSEVAHTVYAFDFDAASSNVNLASSAGERQCSGVCTLLAGVRLPAGALVSRFELEACDSSATQEVLFTLWRRSSPAGVLAALASDTTGIAATPGCDFFNQPLPVLQTIDNENNVYFLLVTSNVNVTFMAVRLYYRLQVTPAPGVATFPIDVPTTHPYFRFVEALARAGITAGCGEDMYCPNSPITRGEMAVFLAVALGLHFVP